MSEVRHPFNGAILGLFDVKQDSVLITQEANVPSLVKDTPAAKLPLRDFYRSLIVHEVGAYEHFKAEGNGCEHLQVLLDGEARFIATLPAGW